MKIIIPMTGLGARFIQAGYKDLKPLIQVHKKPIIEFIVSLFSIDDEFIFICRNDKLNELTPIFKNIAPNASIVGIDGHKLGPVYAVSKIFDQIKDEESIIVNYCDFFMHWDYADFKNFVSRTQCDGCIPSYVGFHPHLLHAKNLYASSKVDQHNRVLEIKEKFSYTSNSMDSPQSAGTYYFKKGFYVKKYFQMLIDKKIELNGEYYVSLIYNLMIQDHLNISVYDKIHHFCQWGTPEDFQEYQYWSSIFENFRDSQSGINSQ